MLTNPRKSYGHHTDMVTGAEELGLCSHGLVCQAGAQARGPLHEHMVLPMIQSYDMAILGKIQTSNGRQKYSARSITLLHK
jgi:hypothetical protein